MVREEHKSPLSLSAGVGAWLPVPAQLGVSPYKRCPPAGVPRAGSLVALAALMVIK